MGHRAALVALATAAVVGVLGCGGARKPTPTKPITSFSSQCDNCGTRSQAIYVNPLTGKSAKATANTKTGTAIYLIPSTGNPKCGHLNVGIGWRVTVADGMPCTAARRVMLIAITRHACLTFGPCRVGGHRYQCFGGPGDTHESESVFCVRSRRVVAAAISNS